jgi:hypothetical protein
MYAGDQGPLTVTRTEAVNGLEPSSADPLRDEMNYLESLDPDTLVPQATVFLSRLGVNKTSEMGNKPCMILLGEPRKVTRNGTQLVVWKVLNEEIKKWGRLASVPGGHFKFTDESVAEGVYTGDVLNVHPAVYVQTLTDGQSFLDDITAAVINGGIIFNTHSPGWASSVYHEILHTFEGRLLSTSFFFKEGFVEWFATQFMIGYFSVRLPYYPPYDLAARNIEKVIEFTSVKDCAKAYFNDDLECAQKLVPLFYKPIIDHQLKVNERLDATCVSDATMKCQFVKDATSQYKMKKGEGAAAWYKPWVAKHGAPKGGVVLV